MNSSGRPHNRYKPNTGISFIRTSLLCLLLVFIIAITPVQAATTEDMYIYESNNFSENNQPENGTSSSYFSGVFITEKNHDNTSVRWICEKSEGGKSYENTFTITYLHNNSGEEHRISSSDIKIENISDITLYSADIPAYPGSHISGELMQGSAVLQPFSFQIPDINSGFEFVVLSDTHSSPENCGCIIPETPAITTITDCINSNDSPDITIISGDLVHDGYNIQHWKDFFTRSSSLLNKTMLFTTPGNHEKNSTYYYDIFGYPQFYSVDAGGCRFVFLDSNDYAAVSFPEQKKLIESVNEETGMQQNPQMNFFFFHHPPYSSDERHPGGWKNIHKAWGESFEKTENSVVFSGHVHAYERFETGNVTYIVCGTGGGELYHLGVYPDKEDAPVKSIEGKYGYMKIIVAPGGKSAEISFVTPTPADYHSNVTGDMPEDYTDNQKNRIIPEVSDCSVAGDYYAYKRFLENIMIIREDYSFLQFTEDNRVMI